MKAYNERKKKEKNIWAIGRVTWEVDKVSMIKYLLNRDTENEPRVEKLEKSAF